MQDSKHAGTNAPGSDRPAGSTDEAIGRPSNWREGRYQRDGAPIDQSVNQPAQTDDEPHDMMGTQTPPSGAAPNAPKPPPAEREKPVTLQDYDPKQGSDPKRDSNG